MTTLPVSVRLSESVLDRLRRTARQRASTPSGLASQLVDEGLRCLEFGGISFRDGPTGRRAGLIDGPDVWEIIAAFADLSASGDEAVQIVASEFSLPPEKVRTALNYYGSYSSEIDQEISDNIVATETAYQSWLAQQRILA